jgi:hypothetical protein
MEMKKGSMEKSNQNKNFDISWLGSPLTSQSRRLTLMFDSSPSSLV